MMVSSDHRFPMWRVDHCVSEVWEDGNESQQGGGARDGVVKA